MEFKEWILQDVELMPETIIKENVFLSQFIKGGRNEKVWRIDYKKLNKENKKQVRKMMQYIEPVMNCMAYNEVMQEIVHKTLELQEQGGRFTQVFGYDVEQYCKDLIKEHPKQGILERIMVIIEEISLFVMVILVFQYIFTLMSPNEGAMIDGIYMYSQLNDLEDIGLYGLVGVTGATIGRKTVYKSISYRFMSCLIISMGFTMLDLFLRSGVNGKIVRMNMPLILGLSIGGAFFTHFIRPLVAKWALKK